MRGRGAVEGGFPPLAIEVEFAREMAEALGRTGARLEMWWKLALALRRLLAGARGRGVELPHLLRAYREARAEAERWRHYLIVQREAIGFRHHGDVERRYPPGALADPGRGTGGEA